MKCPRREPSIRIRGHSGCKIEVVMAEGRSWIEKSALTPDTAARLRRQTLKQRQARRSNQLATVRVPEVRSERSLPGGGYSVRMEYLDLLDCLEFYSTASLDDVEGVANRLIGYLDANLAGSSLKPVEATILLDKIDSIEEQLALASRLTSYRSLLESVRRRAADLGGLSLPVGPTHGDLTLSNVMVASDLSCIGLFDFLDSYLESPLVDIAKVRQDTQFGWSSLMSEAPLDRVRFKQIMRHTDAIIVEHFERYEWFSRGIDLIQAVNLLRISPYARSEATHDFVIDALQQLGFDT
jgi:hypothetical protein